MHFSISLPDGYRLSPAAYLKALRLAMANPGQTFRQSFTDPQGWIGGHSGASIVASHWRMIADKYLGQLPATGKGNRAAKRARALADQRAECEWCGALTGSASRRFCCADCSRSYHT